MTVGMNPNHRLYDVLTRHQIYLEGVKLGIGAKLGEVLNELNEELRKLFAKQKFNSLDALTKAALRKFLQELRQVQKQVWNKYFQTLIDLCFVFMQSEIMVSKILFSTVADDEEDPQTEKQANENLEEKKNRTPIIPLIWFTQKGNSSKVWSAIQNKPVPANGKLPSMFAKEFVNGSAAMVENIVNKGYANKETVQSVLDELNGTQELNFKDGFFNKLNRQQNAVVSTIVQDISAFVQAAIASSFSSRYLWVSVLDDRTTEICRGRAGNIYEYGKGPLPPAHIRCRSKVIPLTGAGDPPDEVTFATWAKSQPEAVQNDIFGNEVAKAIREKKLKLADLEEFEKYNAISSDEFKLKLKLMLKK